MGAYFMNKKIKFLLPVALLLTMQTALLSAELINSTKQHLSTMYSSKPVIETRQYLARCCKELDTQLQTGKDAGLCLLHDYKRMACFSWKTAKEIYPTAIEEIKKTFTYSWINDNPKTTIGIATGIASITALLMLAKYKYKKYKARKALEAIHQAVT